MKRKCFRWFPVFLLFIAVTFITPLQTSALQYIHPYNTFEENSLQEFVNKQKEDILNKYEQSFAGRLEKEGYPEFTYDGEKLSCTYRIEIANGANPKKDSYFCLEFLAESAVYQEGGDIPTVKVWYLDPNGEEARSEKGSSEWQKLYPKNTRKISINLSGSKIDAYITTENHAYAKPSRDLFFYDQNNHKISFSCYSCNEDETAFIAEVERYGIIYHHGQPFYTVLFCSIVGAVLLTGGILAFVLIRRRKKCALFKNPESSATEDIRSPEPSVSEDTE